MAREPSPPAVPATPVRPAGSSVAAARSLDEADYVSVEEMDRRLAEERTGIALVVDALGRTTAMRYGGEGGMTAAEPAPPPPALAEPDMPATLADCARPLDLRAFSLQRPGPHGVNLLMPGDVPGHVLPLPDALPRLVVRTVVRAGEAYVPLAVLLDEQLRPLAVLDNLQTKLIPEGLLRYGSFGWEGMLPPTARWLVLVPAGAPAAVALPACVALSGVDVAIPPGHGAAATGTVIVEFVR